MSRNRITGDAFTTTLLPVAAGGTFNEGLTDDMLAVPAAFAVGTHNVSLTGSIAGQAVPGDGDQLDICDPLGLLSPATLIVVKGKIGPLGAQISDNGVLADTITLNRPGERRQFTFSSAAAGGVGAWISEGKFQINEEAVAIVDAPPTTTITRAQGTWRTLQATQANTIQLDPAALKGDEILITRTDTSAFAVTVVDGGPGTPTIGVLVASKKGMLLAHFNGTNWLMKLISAQ